MLLKIKKGEIADGVIRLRKALDKHQLHHCVSATEMQTVIGLEKTPSQEVLREIQGIGCVEECMAIATPFKLASLAYQPSKTVIRVKDVEIGGGRTVIMAGPCAIESEEQLRTIAGALKKAGVSVLRGSAFKPRTSPYSFQGLGIAGLKLHRNAQKEHGLVIETEVMDVRDVEVVAEHVDIVRIGARNMQNFDLLKEVGRCKRPVILKRGIAATVEEWLMSAEYLMAHGNHEVILCERGIRTFEGSTRATLDLSSVAVARLLTHLPIIVDPSHAAGRKDIIPALSKAAMALGVDGLLIEVHDQPEKAKCDGKQALLPEELSELCKQMSPIAEAIGRRL